MAKAKKVNLRKVLDEILLEGGVSYSLFTGQANPKTGYMVSILGLTNADALWGDTRFLGGWKDGNKVVLDVSVNIDSVTQAYYTGIINKQKCIYDCSNKRYISLPSPQTSGTETQQKAYAKMKAEQYAYLLETTGVE